MRLSPSVVASIEWGVLALTGLIAAVSLLGAVYTVPWTFRSRQAPSTRAFNYLWITRALLQVIAAAYALSLDLRLQVLWSAKSVVIPGGYHVDAMCRLYIGLSFGLLEPSFLLLVLFACSHSVSKHADPDSNPNLFIVALTAGLTLPMCAVQVFAALFSRIMTQLRYNEELMFKFFAASATTQEAMCPGEPDNPNCAVCLFPAFSTLISAAFALMYLGVLWTVLGRVAGAAINRMLARRIRLLQVCVSLFFCASITLRGVSVVQPDPFSLDYVALWSANVLLAASLITIVSLILVWVPVADGRAATKRLGATATTMLAPPLFNAPTELLPLVGGASSFYSHDAPSSDYDYSTHGGEGASVAGLVGHGDEEGSLEAEGLLLGPGALPLALAAGPGSSSERLPPSGVVQQGSSSDGGGSAGVEGGGPAAAAGGAATVLQQRRRGGSTSNQRAPADPMGAPG